MFKFKVAVFVVLIAALSTAPAIAKDRDDDHVKDVKVVNTPKVNVANTPANPVPTAAQGTTEISGNVNATITGTPAVTLSGTPNVNVTNTPIIVVHDEPGRIPYQSTVNQTGKCPPGGGVCVWQFAPALPGHRVVIQHMSGVMNVSGASTGSVDVDLLNGRGLSLTTFFPTVNFGVLAALDQPVLAYYDPGDSIAVEVFVVSGTFPNPPGSLTEIMTLTGYELDCTAAPCAPIAH